MVFGMKSPRELSQVGVSPSYNAGGNPNHDPGSGKFSSGGGSSTLSDKEATILGNAFEGDKSLSTYDKLSLHGRLAGKGFVTTSERIKVTKALSDYVDRGGVKDKAAVLKVAAKVTNRELYAGKFKASTKVTYQDNLSKDFKEKFGVSVVSKRDSGQMLVGRNYKNFSEYTLSGEVGKLQKTQMSRNSVYRPRSDESLLHNDESATWRIDF